MPILSRLPALRYWEYRTFLLGAFISQVGNQVQTWAIAWQVYELTRSYVMVGLIGAVKVVPTMAFSLIGGVIADQADRRKVLLATQGLMAVVAAFLAWSTIKGTITTAQILTSVAVFGAVRGFELPARNALLPSLVPLPVFPNAVSVNSVSWRLSDVLGPAITGLLLAAPALEVAGLAVQGVGLCYSLNFLSFAAVILAVWRLPPRRPLFEDEASERITSLKEVGPFLAEGFRFVRNTPVVRSSMWIDFWATFFSSADALLPGFAGPILKVGPIGYGLLAASIATGSLIASLVLAFMPTVKRQGRGVIIAIAAYAACTIGFGLSTSFWLSLLLLAGTGAADTVSTVFRQTIRQLATPDRMRGRMTAIGALFHLSGPQLGDFEAGLVAGAIGARASVVLGGIASALVAGWWWRGGALRDYEHDDSPRTEKTGRNVELSTIRGQQTGV